MKPQNRTGSSRRRAVRSWLGAAVACTLLSQATAAVRVSINDLAAAPGGRVIARVALDNAHGIAGGTFQMPMPEFATAEEASTTVDTSQFLVASRAEAGKITVSLACATGLPKGPAVLFTFPIRLSHEAPQGAFALVWEQAQLFDQTPGAAQSTASGTTLTVFQAPVDSDQDGLSDAWELEYLGDLGMTGEDDPDADGASNLSEFWAGTAPNSGASVFRVWCFETEPLNGWPAVVLQWHGRRDMRYEVFWSDGPIGPAMIWRPVYHPVYQIEGSLCQWTDDGTRTHSVPFSTRARYYRVVAARP